MPDHDLFLFVSHVSEDRSASTEIVEELERRGVKCWIAPRDVRPGHPFDDEIVDAIERSQAMLLVFSDRCNESEYIRREVTVAGESQKIIIPFRIEDAQPRRGLRVRLSDLHWIDGFVARERAIEQLAQHLADSAKQLQTEAQQRGGGTSIAIARIEGEDDLAFLRRGAELGDPECQYKLAEIYRLGNGVEESAEEAVKWLKLSAEQSYPLAQLILASRFAEGLGVPQSWPEAIRWLTAAAEQNNADAQCLLGNCFQQGDGVNQSAEQAVKWFTRAAEQGHADAQYWLGECFRQGNGVRQSAEEAVRWFTRAAEQGHAEAQKDLGDCYDEGEGVVPSDDEATRWYRRSAEQGYVFGQAMLGLRYEYGKGIPQSWELAAEWYAKAAEQGLDVAQLHLGICYRDGLGVERDLERARSLFEEAAKSEVEGNRNLAQKELSKLDRPVEENTTMTTISSKPDYSYSAWGDTLALHMTEGALVINGRIFPFSEVRGVRNFENRGFWVSTRGIEIEVRDLDNPLIRIKMNAGPQREWIARISQVCRMM